MLDALREKGKKKGPSRPANSPPRIRGATVLIVDPDPAVRLTCRRILQKAGCNVQEAVDGPTALNEIERILPDVVLLDCSALEGIVAWMQRLKANVVTGDTPVVLVVPDADDDDLPPELEHMVDECLDKPVNPRDLMRRIRAMAKLRQHRHELLEARTLHGEQTRMWCLLLDFTRCVDKITDLDELLDRIVTTAAEMTSSRRVSLMLPDENQKYLTIAKAIGLDAEFARGAKVPIGEAISGQAFQTGQAITTLDVQPPEQRHQGYDFESFVSMPMVYNTLSMVHQRVGVLNVSDRYGDRAFEEWELEFIDMLGSIAGSAIDDIHSRRARESLLRLERDLQLARQIQQNTFPSRLPVLAGFEIDAWTQPAEETGGDTYDVIGFQNAHGGKTILISAEEADRAVLMLADATGHGIGPALSVTQVRAMLRMAVRMQPELAKIARHLNEQLCVDLPAGRFITAWLGELKVHDNTLTSFSAGQGPIIRYDATRDAVDLLGADTMPLGILSDVDFTIAEPITMNPGDIVAVISDGVFDAADHEGAQFGAQRAIDLICKHRGESPQRILAELRQAVAKFTRGAPADDDRTAIILKSCGVAA